MKIKIFDERKFSISGALFEWFIGVGFHGVCHIYLIFGGDGCPRNGQGQAKTSLFWVGVCERPSTNPALQGTN